MSSETQKSELLAELGKSAYNPSTFKGGGVKIKVDTKNLYTLSATEGGKYVSSDKYVLMNGNSLQVKLNGETYTLTNMKRYQQKSNDSKYNDYPENSFFMEAGSDTLYFKQGKKNSWTVWKVGSSQDASELIEYLNGNE